MTSPAQDTTLNGGTDGDSLIRVDRLGGLTAEDALDRLGDLGHTGHATNQNDLLDVLGLQVGILRAFADGVDGARDQRVNKLSNWERVILRLMCLGPEASAVMKGRLMSVWREEDSSILAFSAASRIRWMAMRSLARSRPAPS